MSNDPNSNEWEPDQEDLEYALDDLLTNATYREGLLETDAVMEHAFKLREQWVQENKDAEQEGQGED